ncbi:unnamed protein product [Clonostachys rosea]|uniref:REJ domain-containing protein n=1 Tax=Bionectria ochroleuca TaxID=29856 RepID=A0ABY6U3J2_BIOOC|nr:unnamed protein product [Clonostachys rosea]
MRSWHLLYSLAAGASLFGTGDAKKRCRTKTSSSLSASTTDTPVVSSTTPTPVASSSTTPGFSSSESLTVIISSSSSTPESTIVTPSSTPLSSTTPSSTSTEAASSTPSSSSSTETPSTALSSTSTAASTSSVSSSPSTNTPSETASSTSPGAQISSTSTSDLPASTTSSLPPALATFSLRSANSDFTAANDQTLKTRPNYNGSGFLAYLTVAASQSGTYAENPLTLEAGTSRLMIDGAVGQYAFTQTSTNGVYFGYASNVNSASRSFIKCETPRQGRPLQCQAEGTSATVFKVPRSSTTQIGLVIMPDQVSAAYAAVDLVVS